MTEQDDARLEEIMSKDYFNRTREDEADFMRLTVGSVYKRAMMGAAGAYGVSAEDAAGLAAPFDSFPQNMQNDPNDVIDK